MEGDVLMIYRVCVEVDVELEKVLDFGNLEQASLIVKAAKAKIANADELTEQVGWNAPSVEGKVKWGCTTDLIEHTMWCIA
jgi:hypothetical protein